MTDLTMSQPEVILKSDRVFYAHLPPRFDVHVAQALILSIDAARKSEVVLDGSRLRFVDKAGLEAIAKVVDSVQQQDGHVIIENASPTLRATLELCTSVQVGVNGSFILA